MSLPQLSRLRTGETVYLLIDREGDPSKFDYLQPEKGYVQEDDGNVVLVDILDDGLMHVERNQCYRNKAVCEDKGIIVSL